MVCSIYYRVLRNVWEKNRSRRKYVGFVRTGLLNTIVAPLVVMSLIMMLMRTYSDGIEVKPRYVNDINEPILITKILCIDIPVILANLLMMLTTKYIGYLPLVNTFYKYFIFWLLGSMLTAWVDFKPVIVTAQRICKKLNLY